MVMVSESRNHECLMELLNKREIINRIQQSFIFSGYVHSSADLNLLPGEKVPPSVVFCRMNIFEEVVVLESFVGEEGIAKITPEKLQQLGNQSRNLQKRDNNVLIKYRNFLRRQYGDVYEEDEEEEVNLVQREAESQYIRQQNQSYLQAEEEARARLLRDNQQKAKEEEESRAMEELAEERRFRKMSIPDEPTEGEMVRISFRCPDGSTKIRNFPCEEKVELIYNWVEVNEEI